MYADWDAAQLPVEDYAEDQVDDTEGERSLYTYGLNVKEEIDCL